MYNSKEIKKLLGKKIKEIRKKQNLTQEELAEKMNIDQRNLSKIECGNNFITAETLSKILSALSVEPHELFYFGHNKDEAELQTELLDKINNKNINIKLLYQIYNALK